MEINHEPNNSKKQYPQVIIDMPSKRDINCLNASFAGAISETTAAEQYIFYYYVSYNYGKEWQDLFMKIAAEEMVHHKLLGTTIVKLGGIPYLGCNNRYWSGSMLDYHIELKVMLQQAIKAEYEAIEQYRRAAKCVNNYSIRELLESIIEDEYKHIGMLKEGLSKVNCNKN